MEKEDDKRIRYYQVPLMVSDMELLKEKIGTNSAKEALQEAVSQVLRMRGLRVVRKVE